ncbi:hypothetical protein CLU96_1250 [Chryseobacterium sp. 52]|nr:hypothetical protein [Chryseobacterium sp. 52]PIF44309.1 hypothetical protein CLU96_1250 [Chryseobacterium sp. 52]
MENKKRSLKVRIIAWIITGITIGVAGLPFTALGLLIGYLIWK